MYNKKKKHKNNHTKSGFTLIEVLLVVAIIAILTLIASAAYPGYVRKSTIIRAQNDAKVLEQALDIKNIDNDEIYNSSSFIPADLDDLTLYLESDSLIDKKGPVTEDLSGKVFYEVPDSFIKSELKIKRRDKTPVYTTKDGYIVIGINKKTNPSNSDNPIGKIEFSNNDYFTVNESGVLIQYHPTGKVWGNPLPRIYDLVVPEVYVFEDGSTVTITEIGDRVFQEIPWDRKDIKSIILPDTIKTIGEYAFYESTMESISLPDGLITIKEGAFEDGKLKSLTLGSGLTTIGRKAFKNNDIETLLVPGNVWSVGEESFMNNNLHTVTIENGVNIVGTKAFYGNPIQTLTLGNSIEHIEADAFRRGLNHMDGVGLLTELDLPDNLKTIGNYAFYLHSLDSLVIPASLETIGTGAFEDNKITRLEFSQAGNLHTIENSAFAYNRITELTIPSSVRNIGDNAFFRNQLETLTINEGINSLNGFHSFEFASTFFPVVFRSTLTLPNSLTYIRENTFVGGNSSWDAAGYAGEWFVDLDMNSGTLIMLKK